MPTKVCFSRISDSSSSAIGKSVVLPNKREDGNTFMFPFDCVLPQPLHGSQNTLGFFDLARFRCVGRFPLRRGDPLDPGRINDRKHRFKSTILEGSSNFVL